MGLTALIIAVAIGMGSARAADEAASELSNYSIAPYAVKSSESANNSFNITKNGPDFTAVAITRPFQIAHWANSARVVLSRG